MLDILIRNGRIVDGSGRPWFRGDVGILGDEIVRVKIGRLDEDAKQVIDAKGHVVAPGFCDPHTHAEFMLAFREYEKQWSFSNWLLQGVTTVIGSVCGISAVPSEAFKVVPIKVGFPRASLTANRWDTIEEYKAMSQDGGLGPNYALFAGNWTLREAVLPPYPANKVTTHEQLEEMKRLLEEQLQAGVLGLSVGLNYDMCRYVRKSELIALAEVVARYDGLLNVTGRGYYSPEASLQGVSEAIDVSRQTGTTLHIAHFGYFPTVRELESGEPPVLKLVNAARQEGLDVTFDMLSYPSHQYPMEMVSNMLIGASPHVASSREELAESWQSPEFRLMAYEELLNQGDRCPYDYAHCWLLHPDATLTGSGSLDLDGLTLGEIAVVEGVSSSVTSDRKEILNLLAKLAIEGRDKGMLTFPLGIDFKQAELARELLFDSPYSMPMSDGFWDERSAYGSFPRYFRDRMDRGHSLEDTVRHMTSLPLHGYFFDRGLIAIGQKADIVVFDPDNFEDQTTPQDTTRKPTGIDHVLVNGRLAVQSGQLTEARAGKMLLKS